MTKPQRPKISVVMAVYNGRSWLPAALESVLSQTFRDFELVVVDDGSTDGSIELVRNAASADPRIVLHALRENVGLTKALRAGIEVARGEYIARQDVDDLSSPDRLEKCLALAGPKRLVVSRWLIESENRTYESLSSKALGFMPQALSLRLERYVNLAAHGSFFFAKVHYLAIGGYRERFRLAQDYDLILRWLESGEVKIVPEVLYTVRQHASSLSSTKASQQYRFAREASYFAWQRRQFGREGQVGLPEVSLLHKSLFQWMNKSRYGASAKE